MHRRYFIFAVVVALLVGIMPLGASAIPVPSYTAGEAFPVSLDDGAQIQPDIDYPWIVYRNCYDIFAFNFVTGETRQITSGADAENPSISGDWIVFSDDSLSSPLDDYTCDVWAYNLVTEELRCITDGTGYNEGNPAIEGDIVVYNQWITLYSEGNIEGYNLATDTYFTVCNRTGDQRESEIGDGWVSYKDYEGPGSSIYAFNLDTTEDRLIAQGSDDGMGTYWSFSDASTDDGKVVYEKSGNWDGSYHYSIMMYDLATDTETTISTVNDSTGRYHPVIGDGLVTWHDQRNGQYEVYCYDIAADTETCLVPTDWDGATYTVKAGRTTTSDGIVAWHDHRDEGINNDGVSNYDDLYAMFISTPPVGVDDVYGMGKNSTLSVGAPGVLANDTDPENDTLTVSLVSDVSNGALTLNADGSFSYTPTVGFTGVDSFVYAVSDRFFTVEASVNIVVADIPASGPAPVEGDAVYRFYNALTGAHLYTGSAAERDYVLQNLQRTYLYEGVAYHADSSASSVPLYRFYNKVNGTHFFTASEVEKADVIAKYPTIYKYEGFNLRVSATGGAGYAPVYRFYNMNSRSHFYTADPAEKANVIAKYPTIYKYEGVAFFVLP